MEALSGEKPLVTSRQPAALLSEFVHPPELDAEGLARLAMRLSTTLGSISEAFVTLDVTGRFTYLNHKSERLLQRGILDLLENKIWKVLDDTPNDRLRWHIEQPLSTNRRVEFEDFYAGLGKWLELRVPPLAEVAARKAQVVIDKVLVTLREPYDLAGHQHYSTGSIGDTPFTPQRSEVSELLKQADLAMYHAKYLGRNTVCFFDPAMQACQQLAAWSDMPHTVPGSCFYQTQLSRLRLFPGLLVQPAFADCTVGKLYARSVPSLTGLRALMRWFTPTTGHSRPPPWC